MLWPKWWQDKKNKRNHIRKIWALIVRHILSNIELYFYITSSKYSKNSKDMNIRELVVLSTQNHQIHILFNIIEIFNNIKEWSQSCSEASRTNRNYFGFDFQHCILRILNKVASDRSNICHSWVTLFM